MPTIHDYKTIVKSSTVPVLANITEFGLTHFFSQKQLSDAGVKMVLYPATLSRLMNKAASIAIDEILSSGSQKKLINKMLTRDELYSLIDYHKHERTVSSYVNYTKCYKCFNILTKLC